MERPFTTPAWCCLLFLVCWSTLFGCQARPTPPLNVATNEWLGYEPFVVAEERGYFESSDIRIVECSSTTQTLRAFRNGAIDGAMLTLDETLSLAEAVPEVRIILVVDVSMGADAILGRPGIASMSDLKGRRIGYESTALGSFMLSRALEVSGLDSEDVTPVSIEVDEHENAWHAGAIDAIVTFEPVRTRLLAAGAHELFTSSRIPGEIVDVLVVRVSALEGRPDHIRGLLRGWFRERADRENAGRTLKGVAGKLGLSDDQVEEMYSRIHFPGLEENRTLMQDGGSGLRSSAEKMEAYMLEHGLLRRRVVNDGLIDSSLLGDIDGSP